MKSSDLRIVVQPAHLREKSTPQASAPDMNTVSREYVSVSYLMYMTVDIADSGLWRFARTEEVGLRCSTVVRFPLKCAYVCRDCLLDTAPIAEHGSMILTTDRESVTR